MYKIEMIKKILILLMNALKIIYTIILLNYSSASVSGSSNPSS